MLLDAFLRLEGIETLNGETLDARFGETIQISDFDLGTADTTLDEAFNAPRRGKVYAPFGFGIDKEADLASPALLRAYCQTFCKDVKKMRFFRKATVTFRKAAGAEPLVYLTYEFRSVFVTSYSLTCKDKGEAKESVKFRFVKAQMTYTPQEAAGTPAQPRIVGWDFNMNSSNLAT
jgi:type VI protein secretion system component Hcp